MKKILFLLTLCIALISCNTNANGETAQTDNENNKEGYVEVLCFHSKQRCVTCRAIEDLTKSVVESDFADELKSGKLIFRVIDITTEENEEIADKYEVTWSSLFIVGHKGGNEQVENLTEFAFANARNSPEVFRHGIVEKINGMLK